MKICLSFHANKFNLLLKKLKESKVVIVKASKVNNEITIDVPLANASTLYELLELDVILGRDAKNDLD